MRAVFRPRMIGFKPLMALFVIGASVVWLGQWLHHRSNHVHIIDARIKTDMVAVAPRLPGRITQVSITEGEHVARDQILALIDASATDADLAVLAAERAGVEKERSEVVAELKLQTAIGDSRVEMARLLLKRSHAGLEQHKLDVSKSAEDLERLERLRRNEAISVQQLSEARYLHRSAEVRLRIAESELAEQQAAIAHAEAELLAQDVLERRLELIDNRLSELDAKLSKLQLDVEDRIIRSPIDGVIARRFVEIGEYAQTGQSMFLIYDPKNVWVEANVKETALAKVQTNQTVAIAVDAIPKHEFPGFVKSIGSAATSEFSLLPSPNPSGNFTKTTQRIPLWIQFEEVDDRLLPGMMVEVDISVD
ncbi:HlyD family secretion protein [Pseudomonas sp. gcc21]|uniref:HlyD family secretion protein n=1 Tax=Pseudomonas sp. gcc21 TaxID=2726989 RepID=UPI001451E8F3|nr:HlyD family secretion protein [Pseudomonas sp. gcc21]QJD59922.1 HlyD family secretion protein [Pseudomonas sp. gcc21]